MKKRMNKVNIDNLMNSIYLTRVIDQMSRVFTNGPGNWGSIPGRLIPKTQKMVLDATLLIR